jgi:hypothetical protein
MRIQLVLLLTYLLEIYSTDEERTFHVYETDGANPASLQHHCLYYYVLDDFVLYGEPYTRHHQLIPYCIRPAHANEWLSITNQEINDTDSLTFAKLRLDNFTSEHLYAMSAPVDLVEQYQMYLENEWSINVVLPNCSIHWFGSRCQYSFDLNSWMNLSDIVRFTYESKSKINQVNTMTCYMYVLCNRGPSPSCLDWREVCNGIIDCGIGAKDEEYCWLLEMNECGENEYRCHNGAQCIPNVFFQDDLLNLEC